MSEISRAASAYSLQLSLSLVFKSSGLICQGKMCSIRSSPRAPPFQVKVGIRSRGLLLHARVVVVDICRVRAACTGGGERGCGKPHCTRRGPPFSVPPATTDRIKNWRGKRGNSENFATVTNVILSCRIGTPSLKKPRFIGKAIVATVKSKSKGGPRPAASSSRARYLDGGVQSK